MNYNLYNAELNALEIALLFIQGNATELDFIRAENILQTEKELNNDTNRATY